MRHSFVHKTMVVLKISKILTYGCQDIELQAGNHTIKKIKMKNVIYFCNVICLI